MSDYDPTAAHMQRLEEIDAMDASAIETMMGQILSGVIEMLETEMQKGDSDPLTVLYDTMNASLTGKHYQPITRT